MNNMATASLHTRGNILTNSRCPPKSHIENVISVFRDTNSFFHEVDTCTREIRLEAQDIIFRGHEPSV